jgi:hypothetical protein
MYVPPPPSQNKRAREGEQRNKNKRLFLQWIEAEKEKLGGVIKKY